jgi:hypothetical protein
LTLVTIRLAAIGVIANDGFGFIECGSYMRKDPVVSPIFRHIFYVGENFISGRERIPQKFEHAPGHVWVPDHTMRLPKHFLLRVERHFQKRPVGVG